MKNNQPQSVQFFSLTHKDTPVPTWQYCAIAEHKTTVYFAALLVVYYMKKKKPQIQFILLEGIASIQQE